jgi:hypothetical protein
MVGFQEIKVRDGLTAKPENHAEDKKERKEKVILHVDQQSPCVIPERDIKKVQKEYLGKKAIR